MKVGITGASGLIGSNLKVALISSGIEVIGIPRRALYSTDSFKAYVTELDGIINLAGANIGKRWTSSYMKEIYNSRVETTRNLVNAIREVSKRPKFFISASAVGIYAKEGIHDEDSKQFSKGFLGMVCIDWEKALSDLDELGVRRVVMRQGVVLARGGGFLSPFNLPLFKLVFPVFGKNANFPWIHIVDLVEVYKRAIFDDGMTGVYNLVTPQMITLWELLSKIADKKGALLKVPVPEWILRFILRRQAEMIFDTPKVVPKRLMELGFEFKYPDIDTAIEDLIGG